MIHLNTKASEPEGYNYSTSKESLTFNKAFDEAEVKKLVNGFDPYASRIDDFTKYKRVNQSNDNIIMALREMGCTLYVIKDVHGNSGKADWALINTVSKTASSNINSENFKKLKESMKKWGSIGWEFEGDYEILKITFNDNITAANALRMSNKSYNEIGAYGDVSLARGVLTVELNEDAKNALNSN